MNRRVSKSEAKLLFALALGSLAANANPPAVPNDSTNPHVEDYAYLLRAAIWERPTIYVCWESAEPEFEQERLLVQQAVSDTWQSASQLSFRHWGQCSARTTGIRIQVADVGPHVKALGRGLDGMQNGMALNFTFRSWSPSCRVTEAQRRDCIESIAVHEFGHAIGLSHEQNRPDVPGECAQLRQGTDGDLLLTPYDPSSVMNYCNPVYNNNGKLSPLDEAAVSAVYGPRDPD